MNHLDNIASRSDTKHSFKKHIRAMDTLAPFTDIESAFPDDTVALLTATRNPSLTATLSQTKRTAPDNETDPRLPSEHALLLALNSTPFRTPNLPFPSPASMMLRYQSSDPSRPNPQHSGLRSPRLAVLLSERYVISHHLQRSVPRT